MEFTEIQQFLDYYSKVRKRTLRVIDCIPADKIEWTYQKGKFTLGDIIRHIAAIERYMYAENAQFKPSLYKGCSVELAEGYQNVLQFMEECHHESVAIFSSLTKAVLFKKCITPAGVPITLWKWLRLMTEHEIHHRGQLYLYLGILGIATPPLYGLSSEEVAEKSEGV